VAWARHRAAGLFSLAVEAVEPSADFVPNARLAYMIYHLPSELVNQPPEATLIRAM
jgi:hypothetical protein